MSTAHADAAPAAQNSALRQWRLDQGMTLETLASSLGIDAATLSRLERGEIRRPGRSVIVKLSEMSSGTLTYENIAPE